MLVIMEYCSNGNMLDFLRTHRKIFSPVWTTPSNDPNAELTLIDLVLWAHQVAQAMQFLASRKVYDIAHVILLFVDSYRVYSKKGPNLE